MLQRARQFYASQRGSATIWLARSRLNTKLLAVRLLLAQNAHWFDACGAMIVRELNDALLWLTIEGVPGKIEAQLWLSAFGVTQVQLDAFHARWQQRL